jgi:hypothetical protein
VSKLQVDGSQPSHVMRQQVPAAGPALFHPGQIRNIYRDPNPAGRCAVVDLAGDRRLTSSGEMARMGARKLAYSGVIGPDSVEVPDK